VDGKKPGLFRRLLNEFEGKERVRDERDDGPARRDDRDEREIQNRGRRRDARSEEGNPTQGE